MTHSLPYSFTGRLSLLLAGVFLLASPARPQSTATGTIEGRVLNQRTGEFLENARVTVEGTGLETFTDLDGRYRLNNVPAGPVALKVFFTGQQTQTSSVVVAAGQTVEHQVTLVPIGGAGDSSTIKLSQFVVEEAREMDASALAINEQRFAPNIKNVVSTDEFGSIAESNMGEFLKFMPGMTIDFNAGNAREVSIAGVPNGNVPITIDGFNVASTGSGATGRAVALDFLGINNASRVEVSYSPTPESQGAALAGSVNVVPRSSFGRSKPVFNASVYMTMRSNERDFHKSPGPRNELTRKVNPGMDFSWIFPVNKRLGFTLAAGNSTIYSGQRGMTTGWRGVSVPTNGVAFPNTTVDRPYLSQYIIRVSGAQVTRRSYGVTIDYKLAENDRLTFSYQWSAFKSNSMGRVLTFNVNRVQEFSPTAVRGAVGAGSLVITNENGLDRHNRTYMPTLVWRHDGPVWRSEAGVGLSFATNKIRSGDKGFFNLANAQRTGVTVSFADITPTRPGTITVTDGATGAPVDPFKLSSYSLNSVTEQRRNPSDAQNTGYANVRRDFYGRVPLTLKVGIDARHLTRQYRNHSLPFNYVGADGRASTTPVGNDDSAGALSDVNFSRRESPWGFPPIEWVGPEATYEAYLANPGHFIPNENMAYRTLMNTSKRAEELVSSAYFRGDAQFLDRRLKLVGGLRAEQTNIEAHAILTDPSLNFQRDAAGRPILGANGRPLPITTDLLQTAKLTFIERGARTDKEFLTLFPNINASYNIRDNLIVRAAAYRSIGRPDLNQYASGIMLPDLEAPPSASNRIVVNNAGVKPWTAETLKAQIEYYFSGVGLISAGAFQRDFKNFFGGTTIRVTPDFLALYDLDPDVFGEYEATTQVNLPGTVRMRGMDVNYKQALTFLPHWARGVQVFGNFTKIRTTGSAVDDFTGVNLIPHSGSWGISLSRQRFNVRANWNYRGRQQEGAIAAGTGIEPETYNWTARRLTVDLLGEYYFRKRIAVFANLRNIQDVPIDTLTAGPNTPGFAQLRTRALWGSLWTFGVKGTF